MACQASCATCVDSTFCSSCNSGYFNAANGDYALCIACPVGCSACSSLTACSTCLTGYRLSGTCLQCPPNCNQCTASACTTCATGFALITGGCVPCTTSANGGTAGCLVCSVNSGSISCSKCADGYYLTNSNTCATCHSRFPNSGLCTSSQLIQCRNDFVATLASRYYLVSGQCVANTKKCKVMRNTQGDCSSCYF